MDYRTRMDLYLYSGNGDKSATTGPGEVRFYNLRPQGYIYEPSKYYGCVLCLSSFQSVPMYQAGVDGINPDAGAIHFQILESSQPNSISNFNANSGGVSSYSSNSGILQTLEWDNSLELTGYTAAEVNKYSLKYRASDPMSEGVFISSPLESMTVRLIDSNGNIMDLSDTTKDSGTDTQSNTDWVAHIIIQPIIKENT